MALFNRSYVEAAKVSGKSVPLVIGLERENGLVSRYETSCNPKPTPDAAVVETLANSSSGRAAAGRSIRRAESRRRSHPCCYSKTGKRAFDGDLMCRCMSVPLKGGKADASCAPQKEMDAALGGHLDGCRIGFDLGASDYKVAAVMEGEAVYSGEFPWNPKDEPDPKYHFDHLTAGLKEAAAHLPRVDAIGGSSAGVIVNNKIMVASLFRAVPLAQFDQARNIFLRIRDEWKVPLEVANDGDVTALAEACRSRRTACSESRWVQARRPGISTRKVA